MASGKSKVTKGQVDSLLAEFRKNGVGKKTTARTYSRESTITHSLQGDAGSINHALATSDPYTTSTNKGRKEFNLPVDTRKYIEQTRAADAQSKDLDSPRKHKKSLFNKAIDVLMRGTYASAEMTNRTINEYTKHPVRGADPLAAAKGAWAGLSGKKKTTYEEVLKEHGKKGKKWTALGIGLDIGLDPTTYVGTGVVGKAGIGSKGAVKAVNKLAALHETVEASKAPLSTIRKVTASHSLPVDAIKKRHLKGLTPEGKSLYQHVVDGRPAAASHFTDRLVKKYSKSQDAYTRELLGGMHDEQMRTFVSKSLDEQLTRHPTLRGYIDNIRNVHFNDPNTFAAATGKDATESMIGIGRPIRSTKGTERVFNEEKALPKWASVQAKNPEEFVKAIVTHEVGHHVANNMSDDVINEILKGIRAKAVAENGGKAATQVDVANYLGNHLSEYASKDIHEVLAEAWAEHQLKGAAARPLAKEIGSRMEQFIPKVKTSKEASVILRQLAEDTIANKARFADNQFGAEKAFKAAFKHGTDNLHEELLAATARNLSGAVKKEFQIKLGPTKLGIPLVAEGVSKGTAKIASIRGINRGVEAFNKAFRASAHIPPSLNHLRQTGMGRAHYVITQHAKALQSAFANTTKADRIQLLRSWRQGATIGNRTPGGLDLYGRPIDDLMGYVDGEIKSLDTSRKLSGITVKEMNEFLDKNHSFVPFRTRGGKMINPDGSVSRFTKETEVPDIIENAIRTNNRINDPAHAIYLYNAALNQAIAKKEMYKTISQQFGVPIGDLSEQLVKQHGWVQGALKGTEDFVFQPDVHKAMGRMAEVFKDQNTINEFTRHFDTALRLFKGTVTRYNPSFHTRTFLGEMILGYMGGMKNLPRSYAKAGQVIKGRSKEFLGAPGETFGQGSRSLMNASNIIRGERATDPIRQVVNTGGRTIVQNRNFRLTEDQIWHYFEDSGLKTGFAATDLAKGPTTAVGGSLKKVDNVVSGLTEGVEDYGRLAHFIDALQYSKARNIEEAVDQAAQTVRKYHLDYTNVTQFEKRVMTRAIPFYKWARLSTPVMAEILLTKPGKAIALPKMMQGISQLAGYDQQEFGAFPGGPDAVVPDWLRDHGAQPIFSAAGNTNYFDPTAIFPLAGSAEMADTGGVRALNPAFKILSDITHGSDNFGNQLTGPSATRQDRTHYAAAQLPQTNFAEQMLTKRDPGIPRLQTLLQFLANPGVQPNTEKRIKGAAFKERQDAYHHRKVLKQEHGLK